jgi:dTDP-4-dehydrorhamnose reductase
MRTTIIGTSGQLATELRRRGQNGLELLPPVKVDVSDPAATCALLDSQRPALVINAGAYTAVDRAESERERAFAVNCAGPRILAEWCDGHGASLIHVSTDYVFDGTKSGAYIETDATAPLGVYGESKRAGEVAVESALARHVIIRTSWVFSAHGQNFVKTMLRLARERDELRVVADQRGRPTAAADLADALLTVANRLQEGTERFGTFHFAGAGTTTWYDFARAIVAAQAGRTGREPRVTAIATADYPTPARRPMNSELDTSAFTAAFSLQPRSWQDGLGDVIRELL